MRTMPRTERGLWQICESELGFSVPTSWKRICASMGWVLHVLEPGTKEDRVEEFQQLLKLLRLMAGEGIDGVVLGTVRESTPEGNTRWSLEADLYAAAYPARSPEPPFVVSGIRPEGLDLGEVGGPSFQIGSRVRVDFDRRMSLRAVIGELRRHWPALRRAGLLQQTRAPSPKTTALIRFICLEAGLGASWPERWELWNRMHPRWTFETVRAFTSQFHRVEEGQTGRPHGLEWFYDGVAREWSSGGSLGDLRRWEREGTSTQRRFARRKRREALHTLSNARRALGLAGGDA